MVTTALMTADELLRLPDDGFHKYELVRGELTTMAPPGFEHGSDALALAGPMRQFVRQHRLGRVVVETGFILEHDPDTVRGPDVAFVSADRLPPPERREKYFDGAPDIAVEVVSPGDTAFEVQQSPVGKPLVREYLDAGSKLVWVLYPRARNVMVHRGDGTAQLLREGDLLSGEEILPGFSLAVDDLFE